MAMTQAERRARYRTRQKARVIKAAEVTIEQGRQGIIAKYVAQTEADTSWREAEDVECDLTALRRLAEQPLRFLNDDGILR